jgi:hypothetical protein
MRLETTPGARNISIFDPMAVGGGGDLLVDIGRQWRRGVGPGGCSRPTDGRGRITGGTDGSSVYAEFS